MKKTLLAAALMAGFAGIAHADTSVTLYGIIDGGVGYQQIKGSAGYDVDGVNPWAKEGRVSFKNNRTGLISGIQSGSRWGLKGSEDLGNGLRAVFVLESGFDLGTGKSGQGNRLFGRQATLGLAGDSWGQLDFGRQTNIASKYLPGIMDPFGGGFDQANAGAALTAANTARYDNMIMYQTPNFSGFQFGVGYSFNVDGSQVGDKTVNGLKTKGDKHALTTGIRYVNGPIGAALTYDQFKDRNGFRKDGSIGNVTAKAWGAAFSYDFEVVKLHLGGGQTRDGLFANQGYAGENFLSGDSFVGNKGIKVNSYVAGLSAPVGAGNVMASWHMADPKMKSTAGDEFKKQHTYSLGYTHPLSKRTNVYAIGSYAKNVQFAPDAKATLLGVGLRHQF